MYFNNNATPMNGVNIQTSGYKPTLENRRDAVEHSSTSDYCKKLQEWIWQYYSGYANWQSWTSMTPCYLPHCYVPHSTNEPTRLWGLNLSTSDARNFFHNSFPLPVRTLHPASLSGRQGVDNGRGATVSPSGPARQHPQQQTQQNENLQQRGRDYTIPSPVQRFLAEMLDFFILFFIKATIILSLMHLSGMKDISKFAMHFIIEEIDEDTSMEELPKMMLVALVYRLVVCFYEIVCIWGAGGATPGKFLVGLRVVTCETSVLVQPNRVFVVPASNVTLSASTIRALNKNFSIAFFFPAFITLLFFQHNRTVYDVVAGTIVVKRPAAR